MSERLWLDEQLEKARTERDEAIRQSQGYLKHARELIDQNDALRARVAKLEAALREARGWIQDDVNLGHGGQDVLDRIDAALSDAPQ